MAAEAGEVMATEEAVRLRSFGPEHEEYRRDVTYSTASAMQEIDPSLNLLRQVDTSVTIGYTEHRASLYGPPPPYAP